jgi:GT2 family glycosyltransferase
MFEFVSASRLSPADFRSRSPLAKSLERLLEDDRITARISCDNRLGLPILYNRALDTTQAEYIIFIHDDVWIDDYYLLDRVSRGLDRFDVLGIAGAQHFWQGQLRWSDSEDGLSGIVAHGHGPFGHVDRYGPTPAPCEALDGMFLAARVETLRDAHVRFDEHFDFHFYDLDFCLSARAAGLTLGTWPIALTHQSPGGFGSQSWQTSTAEYLAKWGGALDRAGGRHVAGPR